MGKARRLGRAFVLAGVEADDQRSAEGGSCPPGSGRLPPRQALLSGGARPIDFTADIKEVEGKPVAKRGRIPGIITNPRLQRAI
jgi:hypothetical protein